ncbi:hypothetical protein WJX84_001458 [Apatococcus fuscideae]|uniref:Uncharacterized protein n=1 Tax=Apatococcus fuscideae TaxID=2026836 RepID=A0AAW1T9L0_9CHLO
MVDAQAPELRQRQTSKPATPVTEAKVSQPEAEEDDRYHGLRPWVYYLWQYTGPVLALISIIGLCTSSYEDDDPTVVSRMVAYMVLLLVALVAHETRPYKRAFNIRWRDWDEIKEQGLGTGSVDNYLKREAAAASSGELGPLRKYKTTAGLCRSEPAGLVPFNCGSEVMRAGQARGPGPPKGPNADPSPSIQERVQAGIAELLASLKALKGLGGGEETGKALEAAVSSCDGSLTQLQADVGGLTSEADELRAFGNEALGENERLQKENEDLRKSCEDAVLDQQMMKALNETEKLKSSSEAYKKDQLLQQIADKEEELQRAQDQAASLVSDNDALSSRLKRAERDGKAQLEKLQRELAAVKSNISSRASSHADSSDAAASEAAAQGISKDVESLAGLLVAGKALDEETAQKASKALNDLASAQRQLSATKQENERLQKEVDELNSTVFSKSFKAPSAWAEREVKYKMEKKAWDEQVKKLKASIQKLKAENEGYRQDNKAAEFEAQLQVARQEIAQANSEKVKAQQDLHEFQIEQMRHNEVKQSAPTPQPPAASHAAPEADGVQGVISGLEQQKIGVQQPKPQTPKLRQRESLQRPDVSAYRIEPLDARTLQGIDAIISTYDMQQIEMRAPSGIQPQPHRTPQRRRQSRAADAGHGELPKLAPSRSTGDLQSLLQGFAGGSRPLYPVEAHGPSGSARRRTTGPAAEPDARAAPPPTYTNTELPGDFPEYDEDGEEISRLKASSSQHAASPSKTQPTPDVRATPPPDYTNTELPGDFPEYDDDGELIAGQRISEWNAERVQALTGADKATIERQLKEHAKENDSSLCASKRDKAKLEEEAGIGSLPHLTSASTSGPGGKPPAGAAGDKSWWSGRRASKDLDDSAASLDRLKLPHTYSAVRAGQHALIATPGGISGKASILAFAAALQHMCWLQLTS